MQDYIGYEKDVYEVNKKEISHDEVLGYLEEMIHMEMASELEENTYDSIKYTGKCKKKALEAVKQNMRDLYNEKF